MSKRSSYFDKMPQRIQSVFESDEWREFRNSDVSPINRDIEIQPEVKTGFSRDFRQNSTTAHEVFASIMSSVH